MYFFLYSDMYSEKDLTDDGKEDQDQSVLHQETEKLAKTKKNFQKCWSPSGISSRALMFLVFINDMDEVIKSLHYYFADDTQLSESQNSQSKQIYQFNQDLKGILNWSKKWMVLFAGENHPLLAKNHLPTEIIKNMEPNLKLNLTIRQ